MLQAAEFVPEDGEGLAPATPPAGNLALPEATSQQRKGTSELLVLEDLRIREGFRRIAGHKYPYISQTHLFA